MARRVSLGSGRVVVAYKSRAVGCSAFPHGPELARYGLGLWAECPFVMRLAAWFVRGVCRDVGGVVASWLGLHLGVWGCVGDSRIGVGGCDDT